MQHIPHDFDQLEGESIGRHPKSFGTDRDRFEESADVEPIWMKVFRTRTMLQTGMGSSDTRGTALLEPKGNFFNMSTGYCKKASSLGTTT